MRSKLTRLGLLLCFLFIGSMIAQADHVNVPASAFQSSDDSSLVVSSGYWGAVYRSGSAGYMVAPVNLPDGVKILNIRAIFYDNDASNDVYVSLVRQNVYLDDHIHIFSVNSSAASTSLQAVSDSTTSVASNRVVYNGPVQLYIEAYFEAASSSLRLHHVAIEYQ